MPRRRGVLKKTALTVTATLTPGCIIADDAGDAGVAPEERDRPCWENIQGERIDQEVFFDPGQEDEMVFSEDDLFQFDEYDDEDYPDYKAFIDAVDYSVTVLFKANVYPTVNEATEYYKEVHESFDKQETSGIGDEAMKQDLGDFSELVFRKSNAVGHVISYVPDEAAKDPDDRRFSPGTTIAYARELRDYWGGTSDYKDHPGFCRQEIMDLQQPDENN